MPVTGPLGHLDISVGYPARSIAFYDAFTALGFHRTEGFTSEFKLAARKHSRRIAINQKPKQNLRVIRRRV